MLKKVLTYGLVAAFAFSLVGCGEKTPPPATPTPAEKKEPAETPKKDAPATPKAPAESPKK